MPFYFGQERLKLIKRNLDAYRSTINENILVIFSKNFASKKVLLLPIQYNICIKQTR